jgi:chemotaxis protein MotA
MPILGVVLLAVVVWFGFQEFGTQQITAFDPRAFAMVTIGSAAALFVSSDARGLARSIGALKELVPGLGRYKQTTAAIEAERAKLASLWSEEHRASAVQTATQSDHASVRVMADLLVSRAMPDEVSSVFLELKHQVTDDLQPAANNWDLVSRLAPSFGLLGTITGMIRMFRQMSADDLNIGAAMSLALLSTLYGVAIGAGLAGPLGQHLNRLLDERLGLLDRCEQTVNQLVARSGH